MHLTNTKKITLVLFSLGTLLVYSCREKPNTDAKTTTTQTEKTSPVEKTLTPVKSTDGVVMNPSHGQPGHRCDIAVGAPLDSQPVQVPVKTNSQTSDLMLDNSNSAALPKGTPNPAHGQPGHNCAVKVGEPL